ncbi:hypothetical protein FLT15_18470 [Paenibacillus thiaminolyticus]|uniref:hypothetical protein n=1 Tax=Paenibacillus thiaminolyticus TaxID=49283 RepID=UPI0011655F47|nr:hypothetical protein [Paenibacillus thiaminolyticus]NGP60239.1 hypothetical protein [Paenibacillus thiaminolyticus]
MSSHLSRSIRDEAYYSIIYDMQGSSDRPYRDRAPGCMETVSCRSLRPRAAMSVKIPKPAVQQKKEQALAGKADPPVPAVCCGLR